MANTKEEEGEGADLQDHWYLVDTHGQKFRLPKTMLFLGSDECDVIVASQSVDKRHAILAFDIYLNRFKVKDLSTRNGTFVNNSKIPEQEYVVLNHMDSIRLGQDAMMYHMEQASQITSHGGLLPDPHFIPSWANRAQDSTTTIHVHAHDLAECQGCIAEQNLEHSCSLKPNKSTDHGIHVEDPHHSHHHPHHLCKDHLQEQGHQAGSAPAPARDFRADHNSHGDQPSDQPSDLLAGQRQDHAVCCSQGQSLPGGDHTATVRDATVRDAAVRDAAVRDAAVRDAAVRDAAVRDAAVRDATVRDATVRDAAVHDAAVHDAAVHDAEMHDASNQGWHNGSTCPITQHVPEVAPASSLFNMDAAECPDGTQSPDMSASNRQTMFVVPFHDSGYNANNSSSVCGQARRPHSNRNPHSPELIAVKKGTPLYGQPAWWGDERGSDQGETSPAVLPKHNGDGKIASKTSPPVSHGLSGGEMDTQPVPAAVLPKTGSVEGDSAKPPKGSTYMEIPLRDDDSTDGLEKPKGGMAAVKAAKGRRPSLTSSSMSPDLKQPSKTAKTESPSAEVNPAMSFTIDLDDPEHPPKKSLNIGSSISEFVPSKMRKNFQDRKTVSSKAASRESVPSKNSDEREVSPLSQSKIDEIWTTVVEAKGKSRLSSIQSETGTSLRSPNLNEISQFSQPSQERRKSLEKDSDKRGSVRRSVSSKSPQTSQSSKVNLSSHQKVASESSTAGVPKLDSALYLIDKMFEGKSSFSVQTNQEHSPEQSPSQPVAGQGQVSPPSAETAIIRPVINSTSSLDSVSKHILGKSSIKLPVHCNGDDDDDDGEDEDLQITEDISSDNEPREKDDREDKISEAGTYTIEADVLEGHEEEEEARKRIDEVFGVDADNSPLPIIDPLIFSELKDYNMFDHGDDSENTVLDDSQSPGEDDTDLITDELDDETSDVADTSGIQNWVSQLTSLTSQKSAVSNKLTKAEGEVSLTKKPPQGINRKRPGTGRKLPSIPKDKSPVSIEANLPFVHRSLKAGEDLLARKTSDRHAAGSSNNYVASSSQPHHSALKTGSLATQNISAYCHSSFEAEVSFQAAAMVHGAVQNRNLYKPSHDINNSQESDVDTASTVALVNGSDDHVRPVLFKSPRDALAKKQVKESPTKPPSTPPAVLGKKLSVKPLSQTVPAQRTVTTPRSTPASTPTSGTRKSSSSDLFSRKDSLDNGSTISDVSSETGDLSRSSSKGKSAITKTRTNKTFELRCARAGSLDEPATLWSAKSSSKPAASAGLVGRPHSLYSNPRSKSIETTNFGVQVIKKMQSHITQEKIHKSNSVSSRTDSGKHLLNQGLQRASSLTISHPILNSKRESTPKSHLRAAPTARSSLTLTGISSISRGSQSQPGSRTGSPKSAEKMAWKRRKEYDARKSVADAKTSKTKGCSTAEVSMRPKPSASATINRAMTRSASFTNTAASLSFGLHSSVSSSQDFSDQSSAHHQRKDLIKAFLPFHTSHQNGRSTHSADEDDSMASANCAQDKASIVASLLKIPSAFTPPLPRNKEVSPENSSPSEASLTLRRRILNMDGESSPSLWRSLHTTGSERDVGLSSTGSSPQASYDSLIVTSVYQLSLKLKTATDQMLNKLKDQSRTTQTPSPVDDFLNDSGRSEIMAWKTANQELASTLKNLRLLERHMLKISACLFPDTDASSDSSSHAPAKQHMKQKLLEDIERKYGFQPIDQPASPEMEELSGQFHN